MIFFFQNTKEIILKMTSRELYDLLTICNKFLEIGIEFSGDDSL